MKDVLLISADALFSAMLAGELRSFAGTVAVRPSLTVQQLDDFCETVHPGLLILDLDVEYSQFERILGRTVEQKLPVIVFGYPESEAMTAEKQRFYDSDINRYVFVRPFLMNQFLYCAKELLRGDETERETVRETPAMKMKQHCPADDIHISEDAHIVRYKNDPIVLTRTEY
ncbi:MAG: hypothetical protein MJ175_07650, partial [Clostridia bacterium]|nr:hypothetical protein [Clostridia bacterium]